ncbi:MAG: chemotaxis protein CheA [Desulfovibrio sp.]|nr:chemotaxis protein CheA [Desulfovibrio sp.]
MGDLFMEEVGETLAELDGALLELEKSPGDMELVNRVFRAVHTLKGACDMFGVDEAVALAHAVESVFDQVRGGRKEVDKVLLDMTFAARDRFAVILGQGVDAAAVGGQGGGSALRDLLGTTTPVGEPGASKFSSPARDAAGQESAGTDCHGQPRTFRVAYTPKRLATEAAAQVAYLLEALRGLGECRVEEDVSGTPSGEDSDAGSCPAGFTALLITDKGEDAVRDVFLLLDDPGQVVMEAVEPPLPDRETSGPPLEEAAPERPPEPAGASSKRESRTPPAREHVHSLRVDAGKLDDLVNLVGELVIAQARLSQLAGSIGHAALTGVAEEIERLSNELRDNTLGIRMLPIGTTFGRFRRLVRDLSSDMRKQIELVTEGGETELDKTVIEQLGDPLVHLLRNSIDHGIEPPGERLERGKPPAGRIVLSAEHAGGEVLIHIVDDGRGMDPEKIRAKAVERGLIGAEARLAEAEIFNLVFLPGFSTAETVISISGRGVGMDVVKRGIESLRGKIDIRSEPGRGTRITIKLPLTLAIIDGLQVRSGEAYFIIPLSLVEECVELPAEASVRGGRNRTIHLRGEIVSYVRLREVFGISGGPPAIEQVVVTRHGEARTGLAVDEVVGQRQTVIKSLGAYIGTVEGISGATINGDGSMSLILDVPALVASVRGEAA